VTGASISGGTPLGRRSSANNAKKDPESTGERIKKGARNFRETKKKHTLTDGRGKTEEGWKTRRRKETGRKEKKGSSAESRAKRRKVLDEEFTVERSEKKKQKTRGRGGEIRRRPELRRKGSIHRGEKCVSPGAPGSLAREGARAAGEEGVLRKEPP